MNNLWMTDSYKSAAIFRHNPDDSEDLRAIRILDAVGMFETGWMIFDHRNRNRNRYGYPNNE